MAAALLKSTVDKSFGLRVGVVHAVLTCWQLPQRYIISDVK